jgi:HTH-type transcriptional regulator / antitoxin HigA
MRNTTNKISNRGAKPSSAIRLKIIRTHQDHEQAMARLLKLMKRSPVPGSPESDELEVLSLLIGQYEKKNFPMDSADPVEVIKFMMDQQKLKKKDLIPYIGSASKVTEVLNGSRNLSLSMIRRLSEGLGISADVLIQAPARKRA